MADPVSWKIAERGWSVVANDGKEVGKLDQVLGDTEADIFDGLAVGAGTVLDRPLYVPSEKVGAIEEGTVHLPTSHRRQASNSSLPEARLATVG
jgi:hypothetical protein